jgi:hypothetical protein
MVYHMATHELQGDVSRASASQHHQSNKVLSTDEVLAILDEMDKEEEGLGVLGETVEA